MVVEASGDDRDADRRALELREHLLVAHENLDVAAVADVPPRGHATVADGLGRLTHEALPAVVRARRRHSSVCSTDHSRRRPSPMDSSAPAMLRRGGRASRRASTSRDAGNTNDTATPTAAPITVSRARPPARSSPA